MIKRNYLLCFEFKECTMTECPAYNNVEKDECWLIPKTLCKDLLTDERRPKETMDKLDTCFSKCEYFRARKAIELNTGQDIDAKFYQILK